MRAGTLLHRPFARRSATAPSRAQRDGLPPRIGLMACACPTRAATGISLGLCERPGHENGRGYPSGSESALMAQRGVCPPSPGWARHWRKPGSRSRSRSTSASRTRFDTLVSPFLRRRGIRVRTRSTTGRPSSQGTAWARSVRPSRSTCRSIHERTTDTRRPNRRLAPGRCALRRHLRGDRVVEQGRDRLADRICRLRNAHGLDREPVA